MKKIVLIIILITSNIYSQCDANDDGELNVMDILTQVNCILHQCWENYGSVTDFDGNIYDVISVGNQLWLTENLKTTHYLNGDLIPNITENMDWGQQNSGAYGDYDNNPENSDIYGRLYNWYVAIDDRGVCPEGWQVPSDFDFFVLTHILAPEESFESGNYLAGGILKAEGTDYWYSPNFGATNEVGFTALPAGYRGVGAGLSNDMGEVTYLWTSTENDWFGSWARKLEYSSATIYKNAYDKRDGFSIRCMKYREN